MHRFIIFSCLLGLFAPGCSDDTSSRAPADFDNGSDETSIVFLTRDGCANTPTMREHLDAALAKLEFTVNYRLVDQGQLAESDPRRGYPTPTVLVDGRDLFDLAEPVVPLAAPS